MNRVRAARRAPAPGHRHPPIGPSRTSPSLVDPERPTSSSRNRGLPSARHQDCPCSPDGSSAPDSSPVMSSRSLPPTAHRGGSVTAARNPIRKREDIPGPLRPRRRDRPAPRRCGWTASVCQHLDEPVVRPVDVLEHEAATARAPRARCPSRGQARRPCSPTSCGSILSPAGSPGARGWLLRQGRTSSSCTSSSVAPRCVRASRTPSRSLSPAASEGSSRAMPHADRRISPSAQ